MYLNFEKWHGCRNDFVVIWISDLEGEVVLDSLKRQGQALCDRHSGLGADGVLVLRTKKRGELTPYALTIINSDGSIAKNCGNGLRCAALSVLKAHREKGDPKALPEAVELEVEGNTLTCRFMRPAGQYPLVCVEMGVPKLGSSLSWEKSAAEAVKAVGSKIGMADLAQEVGVCEIGNPHVVITTAAASRDLVLKVGPALQSTPLEDGINVHLVKAVDVNAKDQSRAGAELGHKVSEGYQVFVWERGAGETMACGSGAAAVGALALASGLVERDEWILVDMPGGRLYVSQQSPEEPVLLAGPGAFVFEGKVSI